jgi:hypothetical protein
VPRLHADDRMITRRRLLLGATAFVLSRRALAAHTGTTVGAIRWDAWYEPSYGLERADAEAAIGQASYQGRAPSCAVATNGTTNATVSFAGCGTQAQMDSEITAAVAAHIDYWAFCFYGTGTYTSLSNGWLLYQSSSLKAQIKWCMIYGWTLFVTQAASIQSTLVGLLGQSNYQRIAISGTARPLLYLLSDGASLSALAIALAAFRSACVAAGLPTPYVVVLLGGLAPRGIVKSTGADAVGNYAYAAPVPLAGTYSQLVSNAEGEWMTLAATGQSVVPTAMTGWDRRPRAERPGRAEAAMQAPYRGSEEYFAAGTPTQIAAHVGDMVTWLRANTSAAPAQTGLIYSWDEHDEGGSTLNPTLAGGSAILKAVTGAL